MVTLEQARQFDEHLDEFIGKTIFYAKNPHLRPYYHNDVWMKKCPNFTFGKLPLTNLWEYAKCYDNDQRKANQIYSKLQDIKIYLVETMNHYYAATVTNNAMINFATETEKALYRVEMHDHISSFILKYRALWDKFMGCLVFLYYPDYYDSWVGVKSRKGKFKNKFSNGDQAVWCKLSPYISKLEEFDNQYRTAEAHQVGRASSFLLFSDKLPYKTEYGISLLEQHFNPLVEFINVFGQLLNYAKTHNPEDFNRMYGLYD